MAPRIPERTFQTQVRSLARLLGWIPYHTFDSRRSDQGFPDLVLVRDRVVFAELKTPKGRLSSHQEIWLEALRNAGAEVYVWRPGDLEEIQKVLSRRSIKEAE